MELKETLQALRFEVNSSDLSREAKDLVVRIIDYYERSFFKELVK